MASEMIGGHEEAGRFIRAFQAAKAEELRQLRRMGTIERSQLFVEAVGAVHDIVEALRETFVPETGN